LLTRITVIDDEHAGVGAGQTALDRLLAR